MFCRHGPKMGAIVLHLLDQALEAESAGQALLSRAFLLPGMVCSWPRLVLELAQVAVVRLEHSAACTLRVLRVGVNLW